MPLSPPRTLDLFGDNRPGFARGYILAIAWVFNGDCLPLSATDV